MSLLEDLQQTLVSETPDMTTPPEHIVIEPALGDDSEYIATGSWNVSENADDDEAMVMPTFEDSEITLSGDIETRVQDQYEHFYEAVDAPDAELQTPRLIQATADGDDDLPNEIHTQFDADFVFMSYLTADHGDQTAPETVRESIAEMYADIDSSLTAEDVTVRDFGFSDRHEARLVNTDIGLQTPHPHLYCEGVDSLEMLLEKIDINDHSLFSRDGDQFKISHFRLHRHEEELPDPLVEFAEPRILDLAHNVVDVTTNYAVESQFISYVDGDFGVYLHVPTQN